MIRTLFGVEWRQLRNTWGQSGKKETFSFVVSFILGVFALFIVTYGGYAIGHFAGLGSTVPLLSLFFLAGIAFILLFGIPQVFKNLFSASDLELLFTLPVQTRSIFWVKYAQSFVGTAGIIWALTVVGLVAFGTGAGVSWLYYPVLFFTSAAMTAIAVSIAFLFNLGLIQILPTSRAKELMTVMTAMAGIIVYMMFQIPNFMATQGDISTTDLASFSGLPGWLPNSLGAQALADAGNGHVIALVPTALVVLIAVFLAHLSSTLVERGFRTGWIRLSEGGRRKKHKQKNRKSPSLRHPVMALGIKEWRSIQRDLREWMLLLPGIVFLGFFLGEMLLSGGKDVYDHPLFLWLMVQAMLLFFFTMFGAQLTLASVGREGKAGWVLRVLPLSGRQIALGKLWVGWLIPLIALCVIEVILGVVFTWSVFMILIGIFMFALLSLGVHSIGLWIGTKGARYNPKNPQDRVVVSSRLLLMLLNLIYMVIAAIPGAVILFPVKFEKYVAEVAGSSDTFINKAAHVLDVIIITKTNHEVFIDALGVIGLLVLSLGVTALALHFSAKRFDAGVQIEIVQNTGGRGLMRSPLGRGKLR